MATASVTSRQIGRAWSSMLLSGVAAWGCAPDFAVDLSEIDGPRVLAVRAEPAEAEPGERVTFLALVAGRDEPEMGLEFDFCVARKDLAELAPIQPACLKGERRALIQIGKGAEPVGSLPEDGCSLFGPRRPDPKPGEPAGRPVDPDPTGGYYQPLLVKLDDQEPVLGAVRLACGLQHAEREQVEQYNKNWHANVNPKPTGFSIRSNRGWQPVGLAGTDSSMPEASRPDAASADAASPDAANGVESASDAAAAPAFVGQVEIAQGGSVALRVHWPKCPKGVSPDDQGCAGAEPYQLFDPEARALESRREELIVSWYSDAGHFDQYRSAAAGPDRTSVTNTWHAPIGRRNARLYAVLRDGRGGVGWGELDVNLR